MCIQPIISAGRTDADFKDAVTEKLISTFANSPEDLARVIYYLDREDQAGKDAEATAINEYWRRMYTLLNQDVAFETYAQVLADSTKTAEENAPTIIARRSDVDVKDSVTEKFYKVSFRSRSGSILSGSTGLNCQGCRGCHHEPQLEKSERTPGLR